MGWVIEPVRPERRRCAIFEADIRLSLLSMLSNRDARCAELTLSRFEIRGARAPEREETVKCAL